MAIDVVKFFTPWYLFAKVPAPISGSFLAAWLATGVGLAVFGVVTAVLVSAGRCGGNSFVLRRWWRGVTAAATLGGATALALLFLRYERTPFLGARFWMLLWFLGLAVAAGRLSWQWRSAIPAGRQEEERQQRLRKYLP